MHPLRSFAPPRAALTLPSPVRGRGFLPGGAAPERARARRPAVETAGYLSETRLRGLPGSRPLATVHMWQRAALTLPSPVRGRGFLLGTLPVRGRGFLLGGAAPERAGARVLAWCPRPGAKESSCLALDRHARCGALARHLLTFSSPSLPGLEPNAASSRTYQRGRALTGRRELVLAGTIGYSGL